MSATRDQKQKIAFVYSNLYQLYQKGKTAAGEAELTAPVSAQTQETMTPAVPTAEELVVAAKRAAVLSTHILKAGDLHKTEQAPAKVSSYNPTEFIGKRVARPASLPAASQAPRNAVTSLKDNLKALNDLHSRLRFMLQELEDLVKE
jgi:hypothetical protein